MSSPATRFLVLALLFMFGPRTVTRAQSPFSWQLSTDSTVSTPAFMSVETANGELVTIHQSFIFQSVRMLHFKRFDADGVLLITADHELLPDPSFLNFQVERVLELPNGDFALCASGNRGHFLRLSAQGQILLAKRYESDFGGYSSLFDMRLLNGTELVAHGLITPSNANGQALHARMDLDGTLLESWSDRFSDLRGQARKGVLTGDQGLLMGGESYLGMVDFTQPRAFVQKLNAAGQVDWVRSFSTMETVLEDLVELPGGACLVLFDYYANGTNLSPLLVKFSATGAVLHAQHVSTDTDLLNNWHNYHLVPLNDGTFLLSGDDPNGHLLVRADTNGVIAPIATAIPQDGNGLCSRSQPVLLANGDLLLTGFRSTSPGTGVVISRVPAGGQLPCDTSALPLFSEDLVPVFDTTVVRSFPVVNTADVSIFFLPAAWNWTPLALCLPTAAHAEPTNEPTIGLFPNPAAAQVRITLPASVRHLRLLDAAGAEVRTWQAPLPTELSVASLAEGIYVLEGLGDEAVIARKLVVMR